MIILELFVEGVSLVSSLF